MNKKNSSSGISGKTIDCLFIGHYEMDREKQIRMVKQMASHDEVFRELRLSFLYHNYKPYFGSDILNLFCSSVPGSPQEFYNYWGGMSLAIAYLGSYLHRRGYTFDYVNSFQTQQQELAQKLQQENILVVAITTTYYVSYYPIAEIVRFVRKNNKTAKIVVGGPFVHNQVFSLDSPGILNSLFEMIGADIYVSSPQGESTLVRLIHALKSKTFPAQLKNIYYRENTGFLSKPVEPENNRLNENLVDWRLFADFRPQYVNIRTSISCPFKCAFCGFRVRAGQYQRMEIEKIEEELNLLKTLDSVKTVQFIDDTLNTPTSRFKQLLKMLIKNKYPFKWAAWVRCDNIDREIAEMMKKSGCLGVLIGFEHGNNQMLKNMNKGVTVEKYLEGTAILKEFEILTYGSFIFGFPGETEKTAADSIQFIENSGIDFYGTKIWFLEPFSSIMAEKDKYKISGSQYEWTHQTMNSKQACQIKDQAFLDVKNAIAMPDKLFHFQNILHLISKGMRVETLKAFVNSFNRGIKDKILGRYENIHSQIARELRNYSISVYEECTGYTGNEREISRDYKNLSQASREVVNVDFDLD